MYIYITKLCFLMFKIIFEAICIPKCPAQKYIFPPLPPQKNFQHKYRGGSRVSQNKLQQLNFKFKITLQQCHRL